MKRVLLLVIFIISGGAAFAAPPVVLPEMTLTQMSGVLLQTSQIQFSGNWLIVYLSGNESSDRDLLNALQVFNGNPSAGKVAVIVASVKPDALNDFVARRDKLSGLFWFADSDRSAAAALKLNGSIIIMGITDSTVQWSVAGSGMKQDKLKSLMTDWLQIKTVASTQKKIPYDNATLPVVPKQQLPAAESVAPAVTIPPVNQSSQHPLNETISNAVNTLQEPANVQPARTVLKGDINKSGVIDIQDTLKLLRHVAHKADLTTEEQALADIAPLASPDGKLDFNDVIMMLRIVLAK